MGWHLCLSPPPSTAGWPPRLPPPLATARDHPPWKMTRRRASSRIREEADLLALVAESGRQFLDPAPLLLECLDPEGRGDGVQRGTWQGSTRPRHPCGGGEAWEQWGCARQRPGGDGSAGRRRGCGHEIKIQEGSSLPLPPSSTSRAHRSGPDGHHHGGSGLLVVLPYTLSSQKGHGGLLLPRLSSTCRLSEGGAGVTPKEGLVSILIWIGIIF